MSTYGIIRTLKLGAAPESVMPLTGKSEREIERIELGALRNMDLEGYTFEVVEAKDDYSVIAMMPGENGTTFEESFGDGLTCEEADELLCSIFSQLWDAEVGEGETKPRDINSLALLALKNRTEIELSVLDGNLEPLKEGDRSRIIR